MHPSPDDRRRALVAECGGLERRWVELHQEALRLDQEWQCLLRSINSDGKTETNRQALDWSDRALIGFDLNEHAMHVSTLAREALRTCEQYGKALQGVMDTMRDE